MFQSIFVDPLISVLEVIYTNIGLQDLGLAIIVLTLIIRVILAPLFYRSAKDQTLMRRIQPRIEKIRKEHKEDREKQAQALMELYKEHKLNPFSGFILLLVQLPVFIALFSIFKNTELLTTTFGDPTLFGVVHLAETSIVLAIIAAALQFGQARLSLAQVGPGKGQQFAKTMMYMAPILTIFILSSLPSALGLYWAVSSLFSVGQQVVINRKLAYINNTKHEPTRHTKQNTSPSEPHRLPGGSDQGDAGRGTQ